MKLALVVIVVILCVVPAPAQTAARYQLHFTLDPEQHTLSANGEIRVRNDGRQPIASIPLLLYRLFDVTSVSGDDGKPLPFTQKVVKMADSPTYQVNAVDVALPKPLAPGAAATIHLQYGGALFGYPEVMQYVRDTISEEYSLLRGETFAYPFVSLPTRSGIREAYKAKFESIVDVTAPPGFTAVTTNEPGTINVAVARFKSFDDPQRHLRVYAMPEDAAAGQQMIGEMRRALDYYTSYLGPRNSSGITVVEIPRGWGSYAVGSTIFQAAAAFKDPTRANELYHEIAHFWNAMPSPENRVRRSRYFDEAFATYFEARAAGELNGPEAFRKQMELSRESFASRVKREPRGKTTPIADYGPNEFGDFAYSKGAWSLHVLHELLGEETFRKAISKFLADYATKPADFDTFRASLEQTSGRDLGCWYRDWIATADTSALLLEGKTVEEMAARCR